MTLRIGVDVGGTFTDVAILRDGTIHRGKADTTHYDLKVGFMNATRAAAEQAGTTLEEALRRADSIVYSTTVGTNALIERRGARLGLITTKGFEDTVMVGRSRNWADGLAPEKKHDRGRARRPEPLIPYQGTVGVQERIDSLGGVIVPLRDDDARAQIGKLVDQGVRGFVVVLLNSFVNPAHERRIRELILEQFPECYLGHMPVYLSSDISPNAGEYRRSMTVIIDAYLRELTEEHLLRIHDDLRDIGYRQPFFVAKNTGGVSSLSRTQAIHLLGSSPSASVVGAEHIGKLIGTSNILVSDMGGTSFDAGLVVEGRERVYEYDPIIDRFRVQIPYVAHWSIGAGGGSIAKVEAGELRVGPQSAGSNPGPACYARGGEMPTVTDADVLLGYIDPERFLGGRLRLDAARSLAAIRKHIAEPLGIEPAAAAWDIKRLIDGIMGQEMYRICALQSGYNPGDFTVFALGGAGPVHAAGYSEAADVRRVATFSFSSVFGAFSTLAMDVLQTYDKSVSIGLYDSLAGHYVGESAARLSAEIERLIEFALRDMSEEGFDLAALELQADAYLSFGQQRQTLPMRIARNGLRNASDIESLCARFTETYAGRFGPGSTYPEAGIEAVQVRLNALGPGQKYLGERTQRDSDPGGSRLGTRRAYWGPERGWIETPVYRRETLVAKTALDGPVLCDAPDTVLVVPPGWRLRMGEMDVAWIEKR